jgi:hypothetical protein
MDRHGADLGVRETLDIGRVFNDAHKPKVRVSSNDASYPDLAASHATR